MGLCETAKAQPRTHLDLTLEHAPASDPAQESIALLASARDTCVKTEFQADACRRLEVEGVEGMIRRRGESEDTRMVQDEGDQVGQVQEELRKAKL